MVQFPFLCFPFLSLATPIVPVSGSYRIASPVNADPVM
jgi:hypothetical protein